jgi:orotidine-5'-phosphate decarboxylase
MNKVILALDVEDKEYALQIVDMFSEQIDVFKVGLELFTAVGPDIVKSIHARDKKVFLDLKFHDIPTTMAKAALSATRMGVYMFNIHTSAGLESMRKCSDAVTEECLKQNLDRPKMLGVTVLTSMGQQEMRDDFGIQHSLTHHVKHLSKMALKSGLDGVVASANEAALIRKNCGDDFLIVTPGIRPSWAPADDQKRTMTPKEALRAGASFLVIGRSIMKQDDPAGALKRINEEIGLSL